ncbi:hypothetical protein CFAM422_006447 [Trichoderma lentiforme]|uniref:Uncharacterized protein n=1 Tax=Trichoderma lentiforme TaxID=1567552 RepID=A0A9P5CBS0_9HYPO|nr:hypothetical protein CFAM422_006447 [Trichoderma lentiforme]
MDTNPDLSSIEKAVHRISDGNKDQLFFEQATFLLYNAFPKQVKGQYLHEHWEQANLLVNHIVTLNQRYRSASSSPRIFPSLHYISLLSNCAWFLYEKGNYNEAREILNGGFDAYENLKLASKSDEIDVIHAHMLNTSATLDDCEGRFNSQIKKLNQVLEIRKRVLPEDHEEISGVLNNLCLAYESTMQFQEALEYREMSLEICMKHPESKSRDTKIKKRDLVFSRLLLAMGEPEKAKDLFPELLQYFESIKNWYFIGHLYIVWGNYHFVRRDFGNSQKCFLHALEQYEKVGKVMNHPQAAACLYKVGRVALEIGNWTLAIEKFRDATKRLQSVDPKNPQIGRINFMLCEALKMTAGRHRDEIGKLEKEIQDIVQRLRPQHDVSAEITEALLDSLVDGIIR